MTMIRVRKSRVSGRFSDARQQLWVVHDGLNGNAVFATPNPTLAAYLAKLQALDTKLTEISDAEAALRMKREERDALLNEAFLMYSQLGSYVENVSGSDRAKAESSGFVVLDDTVAPPPPMTKPENVAASTGDNDGELDVQWNCEDGATAYEVQSSPDPITANSWVHASSTGLSKITIAGLPSMAKRWARVRCIRGGEQGPWSDPACAVVT
jgi:hypothetical protein